MMTTQEVLQTIFENRDTDLEDIKKRYPYFKLIHLYNYLKDPDNQQNRQMAGLHFTQHYWLQGLSASTIQGNKVEEVKKTFPVNEQIVFPHETVLDEVLHSYPRNEKPGNNEASYVGDLHLDEQAAPVDQIHEVDDPLPTTEPVTNNHPVENAEDAERERFERLNSSHPDEEVALSFEGIKNDEISKASEKLDADIEGFDELGIKNDKEDNIPDDVVSSGDELNGDGYEEHIAVEPAILISETADLLAVTLPAEKPQLHEVENPLPTEEPVSVNEPRKSLNDSPSPHLQLQKKDDSAQSETLLFEPLHTTDYFASQGIKITDEAISSDKIGKQLKSFTQWLKTMKRLPGSPDQYINKGNMDSQVTNLAESSNKEEEIITESMAKAYLQQGKTGKAKEIYRKLSLIYPEKTAYFAALIEKS